MTAIPTAETPSFIGPYQLFRSLGVGGMGEVYLARSPGARLVALKVIRAEYAGDRGFRQRFAREVDAARRVSGFFTPPVLDADAAGPQPWLATAYVPAPALREVVLGFGVLGEAALRALGAGLAEALHAIHAAGLVHRDLKPGNVLVAEDGPRVIDFGISKAVETTQLTRTGSTLGTPGYLAPEQIASGREIGPAADVFSLGCVLAFAATGAGPFGTGEPADLYYRVVYQQPNLAGIPESLRPLIAACLDKDPARRPPVPTVLDVLTPAEPVALLTPALRHDLGVRAAMAATVLSQPHATPPPARVPQLARPNRRRFLAVAAAVGTLGVAGAAIALTNANRSGTPQAHARATASTTPGVPPGPAPSWSQTAPKPFSNSNLVMLGSTLVWFGGQTALGFDPATGAPQWTATPPGPSEPKWFAAYGSILYGTSTNTTTTVICGVDATGKQVVNATVGPIPPGDNGIRFGFDTIYGVGGGAAVVSALGGAVFVVAAIDLTSGAIRWTKQATEGTFTVAVDDHRCYLQQGTITVAVDLATGAQLWSTSNTASQGAPVLALAGSTLTVTGTEVVGLDAASGKQLWTAVNESSSLVGPIVAPNRVFVGDAQDVIYALDPATGKQVWRAQCPVPFNPIGYASTAPLPTSSGSVLALSVLDTGSGVLAVRASDGSLLWAHRGDKSESGQQSDWAVLASGTKVYGASGTTLRAFRSTT